MSNELTHGIISAAIEVHRQLGPGLLESVYEECLIYELKHSGYVVESQKAFPICYKGQNLSAVYRCDLLVEDTIIVELKTVEQILNIHKAQLLSY